MLGRGAVTPGAGAGCARQRAASDVYLGNKEGQ